MVRKHQNQLIKPEPNHPSANPPAAPSVPPKRYWTCSELSSNAVFFLKFIHEPRHLTCRLHPSSPCSRRIGTADERVRKQEHGVPARRHQSIRTPELARGCAQKVWRALHRKTHSFHLPAFRLLQHKAWRSNLLRILFARWNDDPFHL